MGKWSSTHGVMIGLSLWQKKCVSILSRAQRRHLNLYFQGWSSWREGAGATGASGCQVFLWKYCKICLISTVARNLLCKSSFGPQGSWERLHCRQRCKGAWFDLSPSILCLPGTLSSCRGERRLGAWRGRDSIFLHHRLMFYHTIGWNIFTHSLKYLYTITQNVFIP